MRKRLIRARKAQKLTQQQVADMIGLNNRSISQIETGHTMGTVPIWAKLSKIFNLPIEKLSQDFKGETLMTTKLKDIREDQDLTQLDLAKKTGISRVTICYLERGTSKGRPENWEKLAQALNQPVEVLKQRSALNQAWRELL
jgi:transcriptional regulator with XRE-family HTH domain